MRAGKSAPEKTGELAEKELAVTPETHGKREPG